MSGVEPALVERVRRRLADAGEPPTTARVAAVLRSEAGVRGDADLLEVLRALQSELAGAGPLEPLLADPAVTDVLVNGPDEVWIDRGEGLERVAVRFADDQAVRRLAVRLAGTTGRRLDLARPFVDSRLPDGSRLHAVLPPISPRGTCLSLRVLRDRSFTLPDLVAGGTVAPDLVAVLEAAVAARLAIVVSGGTGSGKTTLLGVLLGLVDPAERLVLVEDAGELRVDRPHVVRLETRPSNVEGAGAVELRDLVRQALRMRPDRLVVGEVRGPEVVDLLIALNTGHDGGATTLHANSASEVPARLEALAGLAAMPREALHSQLAAALQAVVHLRRGRDGVRCVVEVAVLERAAAGLVRTTPAVRVVASKVRPARGAQVLARLLAARGVDAPPLLASGSPPGPPEGVGGSGRAGPAASTPPPPVTCGTPPVPAAGPSAPPARGSERRRAC